MGYEISFCRVAASYQQFLLSKVNTNCFSVVVIFFFFTKVPLCKPLICGLGIVFCGFGTKSLYLIFAHWRSPPIHPPNELPFDGHVGSQGAVLRTVPSVPGGDQSRAPSVVGTHCCPCPGSPVMLLFISQSFFEFVKTDHSMLNGR